MKLADTTVNWGQLGSTGARSTVVSPHLAAGVGMAPAMQRSPWRTWSAMQSKNVKLKTRGLMCCCTVVEVVMPVCFFALMCLPKVRNPGTKCAMDPGGFRLHVASVSTRRAVSHAMCRLACDSYTCDPGDDAGAGAHPHVFRRLQRRGRGCWYRGELVDEYGRGRIDKRRAWLRERVGKVEGRRHDETKPAHCVGVGISYVELVDACGRGRTELAEWGEREAWSLRKASVRRKFSPLSLRTDRVKGG